MLPSSGNNFGSYLLSQESHLLLSAELLNIAVLYKAVIRRKAIILRSGAPQRGLRFTGFVQADKRPVSYVRVAGLL